MPTTFLLSGLRRNVLWLPFPKRLHSYKIHSNVVYGLPTHTPYFHVIFLRAHVTQNEDETFYRIYHNFPTVFSDNVCLVQQRIRLQNVSERKSLIIKIRYQLKWISFNVGPFLRSSNVLLKNCSFVAKFWIYLDFHRHTSINYK